MKVQIQAYFDNKPSELLGMKCCFNKDIITNDEINSIISLFPKYVKVNKVEFYNGFGVRFQVGFSTDTKVSGAFNENAIKRTKKLLEIIKKENIEIEYKKIVSNSYETFEEFLLAFEQYSTNAIKFQ